jgi:hypothetical protein
MAIVFKEKRFGDAKGPNSTMLNGYIFIFRFQEWQEARAHEMLHFGWDAGQDGAIAAVALKEQTGRGAVIIP